MGDRCDLTFTIRKQDEALLRAAVQEAGDDLGDMTSMCDEYDGCLTYTIEEANYGMTDEREKWAKTVNFTGRHGSGGDYNAMQFVAWGGELIEVDDDDHGRLMCPVHPTTGIPDAASLAHIQRYLAASRAFEASCQEEQAA